MMSALVTVVRVLWTTSLLMAAFSSVSKEKGTFCFSCSKNTQTGWIRCWNLPTKRPKSCVLSIKKIPKHPRQTRPQPAQFYYKTERTSAGDTIFPPNLYSWTIHQSKLSKFNNIALSMIAFGRRLPHSYEWWTLRIVNEMSFLHQTRLLKYWTSTKISNGQTSEDDQVRSYWPNLWIHGNL